MTQGRSAIPIWSHSRYHVVIWARPCFFVYLGWWHSPLRPPPHLRPVRRRQSVRATRSRCQLKVACRTRAATSRSVKASTPRPSSLVTRRPLRPSLRARSQSCRSRSFPRRREPMRSLAPGPSWTRRRPGPRPRSTLPAPPQNVPSSRPIRPPLTRRRILSSSPMPLGRTLPRRPPVQIPSASLTCTAQSTFWRTACRA